MAATIAPNINNKTVLRQQFNQGDELFYKGVWIVNIKGENANVAKRYPLRLSRF